MEAATRAPARTPLIAIVLLLGLILLAGGCEQQSKSGVPTTKMTIGNRTFQLEVARTEAQQEKGLMERDSMPADHGMIFVFAHQEVLGFWMKNTRFPLDIIFCDSKGKVVSIHQMKPYDLTNTSSDYPAQYAIELNKDAANAAGVKVGDVLDIPPAARSRSAETAPTK